LRRYFRKPARTEITGVALPVRATAATRLVAAACKAEFPNTPIVATEFLFALAPEEVMTFDFRTRSARDRYKPMLSTVALAPTLAEFDANLAAPEK
jgi:hypothetical protein